MINGLFDPLQACVSYCGIFLAGFYCIFNMAKMEKKKKKNNELVFSDVFRMSLKGMRKNPLATL